MLAADPCDTMDLSDDIQLETTLDFGDHAHFHFALNAEGVEGHDTCVLRLTSRLVNELVREMDEQGVTFITTAWWRNRLVTGGILTCIKSHPTLILSRNGVAHIQHGGCYFNFLVPFWTRWTFEYEDLRQRQLHGEGVKDPTTGCLLYADGSM